MGDGPLPSTAGPTGWWRWRRESGTFLLKRVPLSFGGRSDRSSHFFRDDKLSHSTTSSRNFFYAFRPKHRRDDNVAPPRLSPRQNKIHVLLDSTKRAEKDF